MTCFRARHNIWSWSYALFVYSDNWQDCVVHGFLFSLIGQFIDYTAAYGSQIAAATGLETATYPYVSSGGLVTATAPYTYAVPQQLAAAAGHAAFYQPQQLQERMQWRFQTLSDVEVAQQSYLFKEPDTW